MCLTLTLECGGRGEEEGGGEVMIMFIGTGFESHFESRNQSPSPNDICNWFCPGMPRLMSCQILTSKGGKEDAYMEEELKKTWMELDEKDCPNGA